MRETEGIDSPKIVLFWKPVF